MYPDLTYYKLYRNLSGVFLFRGWLRSFPSWWPLDFPCRNWRCWFWFARAFRFGVSGPVIQSISAVDVCRHHELNPSHYGSWLLGKLIQLLIWSWPSLVVVLILLLDHYGRFSEIKRAKISADTLLCFDRHLEETIPWCIGTPFTQHALWGAKRKMAPSWTRKHVSVLRLSIAWRIPGMDAVFWRGNDSSGVRVTEVQD